MNQERMKERTKEEGMKKEHTNEQTKKIRTKEKQMNEERTNKKG